MEIIRPNVAIVSLYMENIDPAMLVAQQAVVQKFNPGYRHYQVKTSIGHGTSMDNIMMGCLDPEPRYAAALGSPEIIMFLDVDCIPTDLKAFDSIIFGAKYGEVVGNAQRSNHIENNQHIFAGPHCLAISLETYKKIGYPSAIPTPRGDVGEEWTYAAEEHEVGVRKYLPTGFEAPPIRMAWEKDTEPYWRLSEGLPNYGIGTQYASGFWHMWQSFHTGQLERFVNKCRGVL